MNNKVNCSERDYSMCRKFSTELSKLRPAWTTSLNAFDGNFKTPRYDQDYPYHAPQPNPLQLLQFTRISNQTASLW